MQRALLGASALGLPATATSVALSVRYGLFELVVLDVLAYGALLVLTFASDIPLLVRAGGLLSVLGAVGLGVLAAVGPFGVGLAWLLAVPCLAAVFPPRVFWGSQAITLGAMLGLLLLVRAGWIWRDLATVPDVGWWAMALSSLLCLSLIVGLSVSTAMEGLGASLEESKRQQHALEASNEALRTEMARREAIERRLVMAQKMEVVGQMAGGVAHDFNNVLTVIQLEVAIARDALEADSPVRDNLEEVLGATRRASDLASRLLAFLRKHPVHRTCPEIDVQISALDVLLRRLVGERVRVALQLDAPGARVSSEPGQIEQILTNLAANARDAMPEGGRLEIATALEADGERSFVRLTVRDQGIGMDSETRSRLSEPFYTTKANGTGLGLTTVFAIAEALGGRLEVDSALGEGTEIRVWLSAECGGIAAIEPERLADESPRLPARTRVVVVDDQPELCATVAEGLRRAGCMVWTAGGGDQAIRLIESLSVLPDIVLTDVVMPFGGGVPLCEHLAARHPGVIAVAMTGQPVEPELVERLSELGVTLLDKPFSPGSLVAALERALERAPRGASGGDGRTSAG